MLKIHILGASGSGKTTLGQEISSRFHIPHYDLDQVGQELGLGGKLSAYIETAFTLARKPGWVTENIGIIWTEPLLYHADYIVLLEVSWQVAAWHMLRRHIVNSLRGTNAYPGIKPLFELIQGTRLYSLNKTTPERVKAMRAYLQEHAEHVEPPDADLLLLCMETYAMDDLPGIPPTAEFTREYLEKYKEKVVLVRNKADRERLLELLTRHQ